MKLYRYLTDQGEFDYERYRRVQTKGNKRKIGFQWVDEASIQWISELILSRLGQPKFGLCHGTRRGAEQAWFAKYLNCEVLGTEISETASQFPNTIQWDFHEVKPEWVDSVDFIYSNSWDHSYDPIKLFTAWMTCVRPGGICVLAHSPQHEGADELDPFGISFDELALLLDTLGEERWRREELEQNAPPVMFNGTKPLKVKYHVIRRLSSET
jgi:hypothetical protein